MIEAVQRLLDFEIDRASLGRVLLGGVDKAVVRWLCPQCAQRRPLRDDELVRFGAALSDEVGTPVGCSACGDGYVGRRSVYGLWLAEPNWRRGSPTHRQIRLSHRLDLRA